MLVGLESAYKEKDKTGNESYIGEMQANFLEQEPIVDFDFYYNAVKQIIPTITVKRYLHGLKSGIPIKTVQ